ncbi:MAG: hypothetical protein WC869_00080 [Phycisphaerae bacterium]
MSKPPHKKISVNRLTKKQIAAIKSRTDESLIDFVPAKLAALKELLQEDSVRLTTLVESLSEAKAVQASALLEKVAEQIDAINDRVENQQWIVIDGEVIDIRRVTDGCDEYPANIEEGSRDWYVDTDTEAAGEKARKRWESMAENDPKEFACMVGETTLVQWGMGHYAGPGSTQVKSLEEWLDLWLDTPNEEFASYDGEEREVEFCSKALEEELGFKPTVAYRHN